MNFFHNIIDSAKNKIAEAKEKKEFLAMVEEKAKPLRRKGYMEQILKDSIKEGALLANSEHQKRIKPKKKDPEDFGIGKKEDNQWAYLDDIGLNKSKSNGSKK